MSIQFTPPPCVISQDEQWTGWYWEDPTTNAKSKIYCKQIICNVIGGEGAYPFAHGISNLNINGYINFHGYVHEGQYTRGFPRADVVANISICIDRIDETNVYILSRWESATTLIVILTIYYTKLSD